LFSDIFRFLPIEKSEVGKVQLATQSSIKKRFETAVGAKGVTSTCSRGRKQKESGDTID
jgi:hypothetical protein